MEHALPFQGLLGGIIIGVSAGIFLILSGQISGISGILEKTLRPSGREFACSLVYLVGLPLGAFAVGVIAPALAPKVVFAAPPTIMIAAGLLVGFGARLGGGCTSGHGVCGLPRLSPRSFVAVGTFMAAAALTVFVTRHLI